VTESLGEVGGRLVFGTTKTHAQRRIPLPPSMFLPLEEHLVEVGPEPDSLIFTSATGTPIRYRNFYGRVWQPLLENHGLPRGGLHVLRHSAAARMIKAGWSPKAVQQTLGHESAAFTLTVYGHLFDDDLDELGKALDSVSGGTEGVQTLITAANAQTESGP
jgi:integrase